MPDPASHNEPPASAISPPVVEVRHLNLGLRSQGRELTLLHDVSFSLKKGEVICLLGESGSGKSLTLRALMRLVPQAAKIDGEIRIAGQDILAMDPGSLRRARGQMVSMIFQEPGTAFDPTFTIGQQIVETIRAHESVSQSEARRRALDLLELVHIPAARRRLDAYPHELSGGLRQRAMIAMALSCRPKLLLADEPTTALDATVQIQVLLLLRELQREMGMATIFVTHDIGVACEVADRLAVMYAGRLVETGSVNEVFTTPAHPYTRGLLRSAVQLQKPGSRLESIPGTPPSAGHPSPGCSFAPRCTSARIECLEAVPDLLATTPGHEARCVLVPSDAG